MRDAYNQALTGWNALREDVANAAKIQLSFEADKFMRELESSLRMKEQLLRVDAETRQQLTLKLFTDTVLHSILANSPEPMLEMLKAYGVFVTPEFAQALRTNPSVINEMLATKALTLKLEREGFELKTLKEMFPLEKRLMQARIREMETAAQRNLAMASAARAGGTGGVGGLPPMQVMNYMQGVEDDRLRTIVGMKRELQEAGGSNPIGMAQYMRVWGANLVIDGKQMTAQQAMQMLTDEGESLVMARKSSYHNFLLNPQMAPQLSDVISDKTIRFVERAAKVLDATTNLAKSNQPYAAEAASAIASKVLWLVGNTVPPEHIGIAVDTISKRGVPGGASLLQNLSQQRSTNKKLNTK